LERHHRKSNYIGFEFMHEPFDSFAHMSLYQDEIDNGNLVMWINIAGQRSKCAVRHSHHKRGHVLKRIWHGEQKDAHSLGYVIREWILVEFGFDA